MSDPSAARPDLSRLKIDRRQVRKRRRGPNLWIALILIGLAAGAWWWRGRSGPEETAAPEETGPRIVTAELWQANSSSDISANGYVIARRRAALSTVLSGRLIEIDVEEGSRVEEGQVVARIQFDDYESALEEADRALAAARARLEQARAAAEAQKSRVAQSEAGIRIAEERIAGVETDLAEAIRDRDRNELSFERGVITEAEWDRFVTEVTRRENLLETRKAELEQSRRLVEADRRDLTSARAGVAIAESECAQAEAARNSAAVLLEKTFVRAPFAGVIVDKGAEQGEVVAATGAGGNSRGSVATLVDLATLEVQIELPETRLGTVTADNPVEIYLDVEPARAWPGRVRQIWPKADRGKGTVEIRAIFRERPEVLRPEMGARVVFLSGEADPDAPRLVSVPVSALRKDGDKDWLFLVEDGKLVRREVLIERKQGRRALLRTGLDAGDRIVDRPGRDLREGEGFSNEDR